MTEVMEAQNPAETAPTKPASLVVYFLVGVFLGLIFIKSEVASWFRIQEMFRFQAVHMYGVIGLAVGVGAISVALMKRFGVRTVRGDEIAWPDAASMKPQRHHIVGGTIFGLGWGLAGACPGPLFALIGSGLPIMGVALLGALVGAWSYGLLKPSIPH
jgi:uncharacterized protein